MTERYPEEWDDHEPLGAWWDPDEIIELRAAEPPGRNDDDHDVDRDPGPWDLAG